MWLMKKIVPFMIAKNFYVPRLEIKQVIYGWPHAFYQELNTGLLDLM